MRMRDIERAIHAIERAENKIVEINKKYPIKYKEELQYVADKEITRWYNKYPPIVYKRKESLYHAYKIQIIGTDINVDFNKSYMDEFIQREANKYIYPNSFIGGYHGGAIGGVTKYGQPHPAPGVPYWKTPIPEFAFWGRPALRSFSPYSRVRFVINQKIREIDKEKSDEWNKEIQNITRCINKLL